MGIYAIVLMVICVIGLIGMGGATVALWNSEPLEARTLVHGSEVQVWRLQPMRDVGLLELTEVPAAWHDESPRYDGTTACVLTDAAVGRVEDNKAVELSWSEITETSVERTASDRMSVTVSGADTKLTCSFGPNEGAERFLRMVESERQGATTGSPAN